MTKEKLNCFPHDKFNPHYAAHTQMVTDPLKVFFSITLICKYALDLSESRLVSKTFKSTKRL